MKKIAAVTATRAEYGVLRRILSLLCEDERAELLLYVTGTHLAEEYGNTVSEIVSDGFPIHKRVDIGVSGESETDIARTMANAQIAFTEAFAQDRPDMLLVVGDRYELLPICSSAALLNIPIAHISGGEVTKGALDDVFRNCVTKMSYLHFPACSDYRRRIIQMGEAPERVFDYGDVGVDTILHMEKMTKEQLEENLGIDLDRPLVLVTFHPVTMEEDGEKQLYELLDAVEKKDEYLYLFTKANADMGGRAFNRILQKFCDAHENCVLFESLGIRRYLSLMAMARFVLGNSSSGIYEVPAFRIPTINVGNRQSGRIRAQSVIDCAPVSAEIIRAMELSETDAFRERLKTMDIPFKGGDTAERIVDRMIAVLEEGRVDLQKGFYDITF